MLVTVYNNRKTIAQVAFTPFIRVCVCVCGSLWWHRLRLFPFHFKSRLWQRETDFSVCVPSASPGRPGRASLFVLGPPLMSCLLLFRTFRVGGRFQFKNYTHLVCKQEQKKKIQIKNWSSITTRSSDESWQEVSGWMWWNVWFCWTAAVTILSVSLLSVFKYPDEFFLLFHVWFQNPFWLDD